MQVPAWSIIALALAPPALAGQADAPGDAPPPRVEKTVAAMAGACYGEMTASVPSEGPPESFACSSRCEPVALGAGVACAMEGTASIGPIAQSCLLAYDPQGGAVRYMCVTSMGEVHDHRGSWSDHGTIAFEPLTGGMMDRSVTERVTISFPAPDAILSRSVIEMDGRTWGSFEFRGTPTR